MIKEVSSKITYKDKDYKLVFNLNVMEKIQDEYKTLDKWGELTDGSKGEVNIKALVFGITEMVAERFFSPLRGVTVAQLTPLTSAVQSLFEDTLNDSPSISRAST
jgi:hypothetical protein